MGAIANCSMGPDCRMQCFQVRLGCQLSRDKYRWTMGSFRTVRTHKLKTAFLSLQSFCSNRPSISVLLLMDNITAISLNRLGGNHSRPLSDLAKEIWTWCIQKKITIHAEHLPGSENIRADWESQYLADPSYWKLDRKVFLSLDRSLGPFTVDLFVSIMYAQVTKYCRWRPDTTAFAVDALSISWSNHHLYLFPPFVLIPRCLVKIQEEKISAVLIAKV